nr:hypothetical protein [Tanacetum cinerariifolium]
MTPRRVNHRNETPALDPALVATVQQAIRALLPELTTKIAASMNNVNNANNPNNVNRRNERSGAPTPVEAENRITHIEKIFEVLGCDDQFKAWLAMYNLDGDAHSWWRAYKFVRLAGFLGSKAGTPEEQARNFKWALNETAHDKLVNMKFSDVAEVANAARNIKILQKEMVASTQNDNKKKTRKDEQDKNEARSGKQRDNHRNQWRQNTQQGNGRDQNCYLIRSNGSYSDSAPITKCTICGKCHLSNTCYKATEICFTCGGFGHRAKD